jgi:hypothetical protein
MMRFWRFLLFVLLFSFSSFAIAQEKAPLGTNLAGIVSWNSQWAFVDVFKMSRAWISQCDGCNWGEGGDLSLSPEGWVAELAPNQYATTIMMDEIQHFPQGEYTVLYEGEGLIQFGLNTVNLISEEAGRIVIEPNGNGAVYLEIHETNPANPIRNIRVIMPDFETTYESQPFHPLFLERLQGFEVLRFMDWMQINHSTVVTWEDRPQLSDANYELGVPVEVMVQLANTLGVDAWFNMPHQANDEYVRNFATYVRDNLNPELKAYIEYSNETWNSQFSQANYVIEQGTALGLSSDAFQAGFFYHSRRAVEMFAIWEDVFGGTDRLVRVLASQAANSWTGEQVMDFENASAHADALAIAPYFGAYLGDPSTMDTVANQSVDELIAASREHVMGEVSDWITANVQATSQRGLELVAYEGGQHLVGYFGAEGNESLTSLFLAANRDPQMYEVYTEYLNRWHELGGGLFVSFSYVDGFSQWGSWGVLEYQDQALEDAPKYRALVDYVGS